MSPSGALFFLTLGLILAAVFLLLSAMIPSPADSSAIWLLLLCVALVVNAFMVLLSNENVAGEQRRSAFRLCTASLGYLAVAAAVVLLSPAWVLALMVALAGIVLAVGIGRFAQRQPGRQPPS